MRHCYQPASTSYESNKPRFGEELVEDTFAVKGLGSSRTGVGKNVLKH
jgi:hypothetical protein